MFIWWGLSLRDGLQNRITVNKMFGGGVRVPGFCVPCHGPNSAHWRDARSACISCSYTGRVGSPSDVRQTFICLTWPEPPLPVRSNYTSSGVEVYTHVSLHIFFCVSSPLKQILNAIYSFYCFFFSLKWWVSKSNILILWHSFKMILPPLYFSAPDSNAPEFFCGARRLPYSHKTHNPRQVRSRMEPSTGVHEGSCVYQHWLYRSRDCSIKTFSTCVCCRHLDDSVCSLFCPKKHVVIVDLLRETHDNPLTELRFCCPKPLVHQISFSYERPAWGPKWASTVQFEKSVDPIRLEWYSCVARHIAFFDAIRGLESTSLHWWFPRCATVWQTFLVFHVMTMQNGHV